MKTILAKLLAVALIVVMFLSLASCGAKPELDFGDAADNLEDHDYEVLIDDDDLDVNVKRMLSAYDDGDNFLYMIEYKDTKSAKLAYEELKMQYDEEIKGIEFEIKNIELKIETIEHILEEYDNKLDSDEIDNYKEELDELEDGLKDLNNELEEAEDEGAFGRNGNIVWIGTIDAIEDSK